MRKSQIQSFPFQSFPKENNTGTIGMFRENIPNHSFSIRSGKDGNDWERLGTIGKWEVCNA